MRQENIDKYCKTCIHMRKLDPQMRRSSVLFRKPAFHYTEMYCFAHDDTGHRVLQGIDEYRCPMIEDAKENLKQIDLKKREEWLKVCDDKLNKLLKRKETLLKEIEEIKAR